MKDQNDFIKSLFVHADTALLLCQRLGELCGHGPVIEQDIAMTNIALDYVGRSRLFFNLISQIENNQKTEDDYAFLRTENEYHNLLIVEYPNTDFAYTVAKQFFIDTFYYLYLDACLTSVNQEIKAIAEKSIKETAYHKKWSSEWVIRLGDGTELSHQKINAAIHHNMTVKMKHFMPINMQGQQQRYLTHAITTEELMHIVMASFHLQMFRCRIANFQFDLHRQGTSMLQAILTLIKN